MYTFKSLEDLEAVFVEKLTERYHLNERYLKKAFLMYDKDQNGLLDLVELGNAIRHYVAGVSDEQVQQLMECYDSNGDGYISYEELLYNLHTRNATKNIQGGNRPSSAVSTTSSAPKAAWDDSNQSRPQNQRNSQVYNVQDEYNGNQDEYYDEESEDIQSSYSQDIPRSQYSGGGGGRNGSGYQRGYAPSEVSSVPDGTDVDIKAKIFLDALRANLLQKETMTLKNNKYLQSRLMMPLSQYLDKEGRNTLFKYFQQYQGYKDTRGAINFHDFSRVLRNFKVAGLGGLRQEVLEYLYMQCQSHSVTEATTDLADPSLFVDLVFGDVTAVNAGGGYHTGIIADPIKKSVGVGPFPTSLARDPIQQADKKLLHESDEMSNLAIPQRFISYKTKTALKPPSNFQSQWIRRSGSVPTVECERGYVFGLSTSLQSGRYIHVLPQSLPGASLPSRGGMINHGVVSSARSKQHLDSVTLIYATAALGVVHDLSCNKQRYFEQHVHDDVTCIAMTAHGQYVATGCNGKSPVIYLWSAVGATSTTSSSSGGDTTTGGTGRGYPILGTIGKGYFQRSVNAIDFSYDGRYLAAIGCDDHHTIGIFETLTGRLLAQSTAQHGIPPQIKQLKWSPIPQPTSYISRSQLGVNDLFCTVGEKHLKLWSFQRPTSGSGSGGDSSSSSGAAASNLESKGLTISNKSKTTSSKVYTCCDFIPSEDNKSTDVVVGGSNGVVYLFRRDECIGFCNAIRGGVRCLRVELTRIFCGGSGSSIKVLDCRTLTVLVSVNVLQALTASIGSGKKERGDGDGGGRVAGGGGVGRSEVRQQSLGSPSAVRSVSTTRSSSRRGSVSSVNSDGLGTPNSGRLSARSTSTSSSFRRSMGAAPTVLHATVTNTGGSSSRAVDESANVDCVDFVVIPGSGRVATQSAYLLAVLSNGSTVKVNIGQAISDGMAQQSNSLAAKAKPLSNPVTKPVFYFHTGAVHGLATSAPPSSSAVHDSGVIQYFATCGEDKYLCVWDAFGYQLASRVLMDGIGKAVCFDNTSNRFIFVGMMHGGIQGYSITNKAHSSSTSGGFDIHLHPVCYRKDSSEMISDLKLSPSNSHLACGSHDNSIYIYTCYLSDSEAGNPPSCALKPMHKLRGHSSYITHLDWSVDGMLLQSTCGAYELLCWDISTGKHNTSTSVSDIKWKTHHCIFGFNVMGIWPAYSDGTDINAIDVSHQQNIVVTADDLGKLNVMNYPCIVKNAPRKEYYGHSSFITNIRVLEKYTAQKTVVITTGGNDCTAMIWIIAEYCDESDDNGFNKPQQIGNRRQKAIRNQRTTEYDTTL